MEEQQIGALLTLMVLATLILLIIVWRKKRTQEDKGLFVKGCNLMLWGTAARLLAFSFMGHMYYAACGVSAILLAAACVMFVLTVLCLF